MTMAHDMEASRFQKKVGSIYPPTTSFCSQISTIRLQEACPPFQCPWELKSFGCLLSPYFYPKMPCVEFL